MNKYHNLSAKLFPLGLIVLLFGLSTWLNEVSNLSTQGKSLDPQKPEYIVMDATAKRFNKQGELFELLLSKKTWQLPNSDIIYTQAPRFTAFELGEKRYYIEGRFAEYNNKTKDIFFNQDVKMIKMPDPKQPEATVSTTQLTANADTQTVSSAQKVDYTYGGSHGSAVGFDYNHKSGVLNLKSRVSVTYDVNQKN